MNSNTPFHYYHPDSNYSHKRVSLNNRQRPPLVRSTSLLVRKDEENTAKKKKKSVRFRDNASLENVRLFLKTQMPKACKADPICQQKYNYQLHKLNWSTQRNPVVQLESMDLLHQEPYLFLAGSITVSNLAFEKQVEVRYTIDNWETTRFLNAHYHHSTPSGDCFQFKLPLLQQQPEDESPIHIQLAVCYSVASHQYWDNNHHLNYKLKITPIVEFDDSTASSSDDDEDSLLSPPLSPTAPVDTNPLYQNHYFQQQQHLSSFIHNYCFYNPLYDLTQKVIHSA